MSLIKKDTSTERHGNSLYNEAVVLEGHDSAVLTAKFSHDGSSIASGSMDRSILLFHLPTYEREDINYGVLKGHKSAVTSIRWLYDDYSLISSSADTTLGLWDLETGSKVRKFQAHDLHVNEVDVSKNLQAVSVGDDSKVVLWDMREKNEINVLDLEYPLLCCTFNKEGSVFYVSGIEPTIRAFDMRKQDKALWKCDTNTESVTSLSINNDDSMLLSRSLSGNIRTYSAKVFVPEGISRKSPFIYDGAPSGNENYSIRACFSPDNTAILSGAEDKTATLFDLKSRNIKNKFIGHKASVIDVDFSTKGRFILSTSVDNSIIVREY